MSGRSAAVEAAFTSVWGGASCRCSRAASASDGYIAAITAARGMIVVTQDTSLFEALGPKTADPWEVEVSPG